MIDAAPENLDRRENIPEGYEAEAASAKKIPLSNQLKNDGNLAESESSVSVHEVIQSTDKFSNLKVDHAYLARIAALSGILNILLGEIYDKDFTHLDYRFVIRSVWEFDLIACFLCGQIGLRGNPGTAWTPSTVHEIIIEIDNRAISASTCFSDSVIAGSELRAAMK